MIACDNVQNLAVVKREKKKFQRPNLEPNGPKSGLKLVFLLFSQVWIISFV